jgi:hypothetical protein
MKTRIENIISNYIANEMECITEHDEIRAILKPLEGQLITLNAKRLGKYTLVKQYGMFYLKGKFEHLIGYDTEPVISIGESKESRGFEYFDSCHGSAARERIEQLKSMDIDKAVKLFSEIESKFNDLCRLFGDIEREKLGSFNNPIYYNILRDIHKDAENGRGVKLSDFYFIRK